MANEVLWNAPTPLVSGIAAASLSSGANILGSEIDNESNLDRFLAVELTFTCAVAPTANGTIELYVIYALDGTNYERGDATPTDPTKAAAATFAAASVTVAQTGARFNIPIGPFAFKILLKSEIDRDATAVTVDAYSYNEDIQ
jgi:hypothetical protein